MCVILQIYHSSNRFFFKVYSCFQIKNRCSTINIYTIQYNVNVFMKNQHTLCFLGYKTDIVLIAKLPELIFEHTLSL